jgi:O-phosphoseryl-tRNA(Cys) synthetase
MSTKLNKLFAVMNVLVDRVEILETTITKNNELIEGQGRRISELEGRAEEQDRKMTLNKVLLTYEKINSSSDTLKTEVSRFLTVEMKIAPAVMSGIIISKFGRGSHTVILELSSIEAKREVFRAKKKHLPRR